MPIHQTVRISKPPRAVYDILTESEKFAALGGGAAEISRHEGGAISLFDGAMTGFNLELVPGKRVVQSWRADYWPQGVHSIVRFEMAPEEDGTRLVFDQIGHPDGDEEALSQGWHDYYWQPMNEAD